MNKLKVVNGEISYLSDADDQTCGMWCPVSYDTPHRLKDGDCFYLDRFDEIGNLVLRIAELEGYNLALANESHAQRERIDELRRAIISNCYDDPSTSGKRLMALVTKGGE